MNQETLAQAVQALNASQWMRSEQIAAQQHADLVRLAKHCEVYSTHFRMRLQAAELTPDDLSAPENLTRLPLLLRRDLQRATNLFCTGVPTAHLPTFETKTSGSTGEPVMVRRTQLNQLDWLATTMREHIWHERDFARSFCAIRANISTPTQIPTWGPPASLLRQTGPALGLPITMSIEDQIAHIAKFKPNTLLVYPSNLAGLVQHCGGREIRLPGVTKVLTIGETLSPATREQAAALFDVEISDMYSSQEAGNIAIQCPEMDLYHVMAENLIVEVLDENGAAACVGQIGRVVITDLHNFATPLIRYDIGDYAEAGPACPCGRGLPTLKRILGRERNLIRMPDGSRHWPLVGFHKFREIAPIVQYQMIQEDREHIELRLVTERPLTQDEERTLTVHVQASLGHAFELRISYFDGEIPKGTNGKFEEFLCRAV